MISELYIRNFAIIDELRLNFDKGFNVLTGETGAGKSIIIDAVTLVLGDRADTTMIRAGSSEAYVEAIFEMNGITRQTIVPILQEEGLEDESEHILVIARELRDNGRSIARVNGRTVNLSLLKQITELLIDIHGQGEHLSLLKPKSHLPLLDAYAGLVDEREKLSTEIGQLNEVQQKINNLRRDERMINQRSEMLQYQIQEINAANLKIDEEEELRAERVRLANAEQLTQSAGEAMMLMRGVEDDNNESIADKLSQVERVLSQLARFDQTQSSRLETFQGLAFQFNESVADLQDYLDELEFNPDRLNYVEERLELINVLKRKYGQDIAAILAWRDKAEEELSQISNSQEQLEKLEIVKERFLREIGQKALALSQKRKTAAQKLAIAVENQLADLQMDGTRFQVDFACQPDDNGVYVEKDGQLHRFSFNKTGIDQVEFLISTNPGEPLKPMAKVASGGETSRLMLALKTVLSEADETPTLIFDEIDQGIGGRVGAVAGRKLWGLTKAEQHQVIVVTHLPQLAGYGDRHFHVSKQMKQDRTITNVENLDKNGRINELAAMLGTLGEHATGGAESILKQVAGVKER